ncbi:DEAD/DEAH box helicase [Carpediemonas membranifera]|uniref:DEAD/DEAH box helicase n=1 Tax=Carpediemonas membranifera TaxID=201153 RepID=A0A8J6C1K8_9EUKA|nr:DEAD/DEAH box helicase [Carpediemonas membranifera]|eukprot:KAG9397686.1 DEAD/DEAH box helicase [Carpediemonas membranifera]
MELEEENWFEWIANESADEQMDNEEEPMLQKKAKKQDKVRDRLFGSKQDKQRQKEAATKASTKEEEEQDVEVNEDNFFEAEHQIDETNSWRELGLHTLLVRTLMSDPLNFYEPTPVQARTIPVAMKGRDVCVSAETGSGKTAAFGLPILHRLMVSDRSRPAIRAVIISPTRELAVQTVDMLTALATKIVPVARICLIVGGRNDHDKQRAELNTLPDVIVATPARLIDHVTNQRGGALDLGTVEVLVLDEADRVLKIDFLDQILEITRALPRVHQTMLFSATMTEQVSALMEVMRKPVRIRAEWDSRLVVAKRLQQEFIRIRVETPQYRQAVVHALLTHSFASNTAIVFLPTKKEVHETKVLLEVLGHDCVELQGDLNQTDRLHNLSKFREGHTRLILCTDVAARGLDIPSVDVVINYSVPQSIETYVHRVGRTARAKRTGRSVTLFGESDPRTVIKKLMGLGSKDIPAKQRKIATDAMQSSIEAVKGAADAVKEALLSEEIDKEIGVADKMAEKATRVAKKGVDLGESKSWFMSKAKRQQLNELQRKIRKGDLTEREAFKLMKAGPTAKIPMTEEDKEKADTKRAVRSAKKVAREAKLASLNDPDRETRGRMVGGTRYSSGAKQMKRIGDIAMPTAQDIDHLAKKMAGREKIKRKKGLRRHTKRH